MNLDHNKFCKQHMSFLMRLRQVVETQLILNDPSRGCKNLLPLISVLCVSYIKFSSFNILKIHCENKLIVQGSNGKNIGYRTQSHSSIFRQSQKYNWSSFGPYDPWLKLNQQCLYVIHEWLGNFNMVVIFRLKVF